MAIVMIHQAKNASDLTGKTPVFLVGGGSIIDPVVELQRMLELDPVPASMEQSTPLFRKSDGAALTRADISEIVKHLMSSVGLNPAHFGAHSLRIGGATAALAAGISPAVIRITGRWKSDVWMTYARLTKQSALKVAAVIGSTAFEDAERRGFVTEELELVQQELDRVGHAHRRRARRLRPHLRWRKAPPCRPVEVLNDEAPQRTAAFLTNRN